jgi:hypothetical protein
VREKMTWILVFDHGNMARFTDTVASIRALIGCMWIPSDDFDQLAYDTIREIQYEESTHDPTDQLDCVSAFLIRLNIATPDDGTVYEALHSDYHRLYCSD